MSLLSILSNREPAVRQQPSGATPITEDLESVLMDLARYGRPRIGQYGDDNTWNCTIEASISPIGAKFEVRSDFKQTTPLAAALQCRDRLREAVKALGGHT